MLHLFIIIPIMAGFGASEMQMMLYTCLVVATGTFGYYFSPVHMCQILTIEYFKTDLARLLKEYRYYLPDVVQSSYGRCRKRPEHAQNHP